LHFVWKHRLLGPGLRTREGEPVEVLSAGTHNYDAGPDFIGARLRVGDTLWAGNVEIHLRGSDWARHGHDSDPAYDGVVLHVVGQDDRPALTSQGRPLATCELRHDPALWENYERLRHNDGWVACQQQLPQVPAFRARMWLDKVMVEKSQKKAEEIFRLLDDTRNDWQESFYIFLARSFGFGTNSMPFEALAKSLPQRILAKHKDQPMQLEALLFGQSGLLETANPLDEYGESLRREHKFLAHKYGLRPIDGSWWKFSKLRPSGFPTLRIALFATLTHRSNSLFSKAMEAKNPEELWPLFDVEASEYWQSHHHFGKKSKKQSKRLGISSFYRIVANAIVPFLFVYGKSRDKADRIETAFDFLDKLPAESNSIVRAWESAGYKAGSLGESLALVELKKSYCEPQRCLDCAIGSYLIRNQNSKNR